MPQPLPDGLYDQLLTDDLVAELGQRFHKDHYTLKDLDAGSGAHRLAEALAEQLANVLQDFAPNEAGDAATGNKTSRLHAQLEFVNAMLVDLRKRLAERYPDKDYSDNVRLLATPAK